MPGRVWALPLFTIRLWPASFAYKLEPKLDNSSTFNLIPAHAFAMVFYFTSTVVDPPVTLFMGEDKHENENLIRWGWPEDVW